MEARVKFLIPLLLISTSSFAQQTNLEKAVSQKLMQEIGIQLQCSVENLSLKEQLEAAKITIKELEEKFKKDR